ncbi:MAG: hypothetical protein LUF82_03130 [Clostridia bacterium]|nr:hypothetical protein [Clostridia bacterium]
MLTADWIFIAAIVICVVLGMLLGFGKGLKFFTSGIFGIIISAFICYLILGFVLDISFVQNLLADFDEWLYSSGSVGTFFADIGIGKVVVAVVLFIIIQLLRMLVVQILKSIMEIDNKAVKVINSTLGIVFMLAVMFAILLIVFQVFEMIGGETYDNFLSNLEGSALLLDKLCINNPLISIFS